MTDFTRSITGFRYVNTQHGDTLQAIALRELGDASLWSTLVWFNNLQPPYIVDDPSEAGAGVIVTGSTIAVPAAVAEVDADVSPDEVFLADAKLVNGQLQFENGDMAVVSGRENLDQAVGNRMQTNNNELLFHPTYGLNFGRLKGALNGAVLELVAEQYVVDGMRNENRIKQVSQVTASSSGDRLIVQCELVPISGVNINITKVV